MSIPISIPISDRNRLLQIVQRADHPEADYYENSIQLPAAEAGGAGQTHTNMPEKSWENKQLSEKQISVDPISIQQQREAAAEYYMPPPAKTKLKFVSCSLPNSASSSPARFTKKNIVMKKDQGMASPMERQGSVALRNLERLRECHLQRSKSCGDGRASQPSVDFDLLSSPRPQLIDHNVNDMEKKVNIITHANATSQGQGEGKTQVFRGTNNTNECPEPQQDKFICGLICPFLPSFGKAKAVGSPKPSSPSSSKDMQFQENMIRRTDSVNTNATAVSKRVSLEKFECGSWRSSAVINCDLDDGLEESVFFDLPVELIRCSSANDTESPITTGFVFDDKTTSADENNHDHVQNLKGVLKNSRSSSRGHNNNNNNMQESWNPSPRHVRFSTSSPSRGPSSPSSACVSPHLHKVRDDFNAFLEAQSA